jgi:hypothetical protein
VSIDDHRGLQHWYLIDLHHHHLWLCLIINKSKYSLDDARLVVHGAKEPQSSPFCSLPINKRIVLVDTVQLLCHVAFQLTGDSWWQGIDIEFQFFATGQCTSYILLTGVGTFGDDFPNTAQVLGREVTYILAKDSFFLG